MKKIFILFLILFSPIQVMSKEKVTLVTFLIPRYIESPLKGDFITLTKKIAAMSGYELSIKVYPAKRSLNVFHDGKADGYFPALDTLSSATTYKTSNFYIKKDFIFQLNNSDYTKIKQPKLCLTRGYPYTKEVLENKKWQLVYAKSDKQCFELLKIGRVHLFIGEEVTALEAIKTSKLQGKVYYDQSKPVSSQEVYFAFSETAKGKILSQKFDKALKKLIESGEYNLLFPTVKK